jgi:hypothetical protein
VTNVETTGSRGVQGGMRLPDFIGIGAQRAGSTTLAALLDQQPNVVVSEPKETHFFDNRDGMYDEGLEWYSRHFSDMPPDAVCGEFTPCYMFVNEVAERIRSAVPDVRLVAILRDPVPRAWSHYWFNVRRGWEPKSFERALDAEEKRGGMGEWERVVYGYEARGRYVEQLQHYERVFSREQLCVVFLEELKTAPEETLETVLGHLGLQGTAVDLGTAVPERNAGVRPRSRRLHVATTRARRWSAGKGGAVQAVVRLGTAPARRLNRSTGGLPSMSADTRSRLRKGYAESDAALAAWLGRSLPWAEKAAAES